MDSEIGPGFGQPSCTPPTKNSEAYPQGAMMDKVKQSVLSFHLWKHYDLKNHQTSPTDSQYGIIIRDRLKC